VIITTAFGLKYLRTIPSGRGRAGVHFQIWFVIVLLLTLRTVVLQAPAAKISQLWKISGWTPMKIHKISQSIVAQAKGSKMILTFSPLYAIEGGGNFYREFSAGTLAYRIADEFSDYERAITHTAGLPQLPALMKETPPDAIVISPELTRFEKIALKNIIPPGWQLWDCNQSSARIYFPR
jgi:hypothetical protein